MTTTEKKIYDEIDNFFLKDLETYKKNGYLRQNISKIVWLLAIQILRDT